MHIAYLLTGGNRGNREDYLGEALTALQKENVLLAASAIYQTAAWGKEDQPDFLNQAIKIGTHLTPANLLRQVLDIELRLGRTRDIKYGPRSIDIDILFYDDWVIEEPSLVVPHPHLQNRRFALQCLADIAPEHVHPRFGKTIRQLLEDCNDPLQVHKWT
jgi:2-amino-4-hydroxy-6-hydroxymethyldihydropteridine diphosphokinase